MKIAIARVYIGGGRRYFTLRAACNAEAKALVRQRAIKRQGYWLDEDDEYPAALIARVAQILAQQHRRGTP